MSNDENVEELREEVKSLRKELEEVKNQETGGARREEVSEIQGQIRDAAGEKDTTGLSRRDFLKAMGGGAAGIGAAAMLPSVAGFSFSDDNSFKFGNLSSSQTNFEVGTQGDLDLHGNNIANTGSVNADQINANSVTTDHLSNKPEKGSNKSIRQKHHEDALNEGYAVGWAPGYHKVVDPRDYADDSAALQDLNDSLVANAPDATTVEIWMPGHRPDGASYVLERTVQLGVDGEDVRVVPKGWNHGFGSGSRIESNITDGSPMFLLDNGSGSYQMQHQIIGDGMTLNAAGADCKGIRFNDVVQFGFAHVMLQAFTNHAAIQFDGTCFNGWVDDINWAGGDGTADCIVLTNEGGSSTDGNATPGEIRYGSGMNLSKGGFARGLVAEVNASKQKWLGGRIEGAEGQAAIHFKDGQLTLTAGTELGRNDGSSTKHVIFDGRKLIVDSSTTISNSNSDSIHVTADNYWGYIGQLTHVNQNISGDVIKIDNNPNANYNFLVPRESAVAGTVTYPAYDTPWTGLRYTDGWQPFRSGTSTIPANSTVELVQFASIDRPIRVGEIDIQDAEADVFGLTPVYGWRESSSTDGQQSFGFHNFAGSSLDVSWTLERL